MSQDDLPELTLDQYEQLREDIRLRGVQTPIEICANSNEILDGRARVRACSELKINNYPRRIVGGLDSEEARRHHRLKANCLRRHLDRPTLKDLVLAEMRMKAQSDRLLAGIFGLSHTGIGNWRREFLACGKLLPQETYEGKGRKYRRSAAIYAQTPVAADRAARVLAELGEDAPPGRHLSPRTASELVLQKRRERADGRQTVLPPRIKLYQGRFQEVGVKLKDGSVDCIFTDPLYCKEWVDQGQWADLARLATRVLKPGGLLCTYSGVAYLDRVMSDLGSSGLDYLWMVSVRGSGASTRHWNKNVINKWKPILIYGKGLRRLPSAVFDFCEGSGRDKTRHEYEQPEQECEYYLSRLLAPGARVLDCCCGSGTTLVVARRLGMDAIGIDQDPEAISLTKERLRESQAKKTAPASVPALSDRG